MQLATAGVAACIADMITFPLDTTKVMDVLIVIVVTNVNQTIIYITIVVTKISSLSITNPTMSRWDSKSRESWAVTMALEHNLAEWFVFLLISSLYCHLEYLPSLDHQYPLLSLLAITTLQLGTLVSVARNEGLTALYSGIVPGLQRQMAFSAIRCHLETDFKFRFKEKVKVSFLQLKCPGSEPTSRWRKSTWTTPGRAVDLVWWDAGLLLVLPQVRSLSGFRCGEGGVIRL